jgi:hypothetical protein
VGSDEAFQRIFRQAIKDGRLTETEFHLFDAAEAIRVFLVPAPADEAHPPAVTERVLPLSPPTAGAETRTKNRLVALMGAGDPTQSKLRYRQEAERDFAVGKRAFDRAWVKAIEASGNKDWSRPGRRRKSTQ